MKRYAAATGQKVQGVPAPTGLKAKLAGSKLWLVVLALEDERRLGDQAFDDEDAQEGDVAPTCESVEEAKSQTKLDPEKVPTTVHSPDYPPPAYSGTA